LTRYVWLPRSPQDSRSRLSQQLRRLRNVGAAATFRAEAVAGDVDALGLAAKLANSIGRSNTLHKTYAPVDIEAVRNTDSARLKGRRKMRDGNKAGDFVSTQQSSDISTFKVRSAK
jgi:hypothetical protein